MYRKIKSPCEVKRQTVYWTSIYNKRQRKISLIYDKLYKAREKDISSSRNAGKGYCFGLLAEPPNPFSLPSIVRYFYLGTWPPS